MTTEDYRLRWPHGRVGNETCDAYDEVVGDVNKALLDLVLAQCAKLGMRPRNLDCGDTYFIFSGAPNSRCSFSLTGLLPGWRFGAWLEGQLLTDDGPFEGVDEDTPVVRLFCQHVSLIDKFKPSCSPVRADVTLRDVRLMLEGKMPERIVFEVPVQRLVLAVRRHPALVYTDNVDAEYPPAKRIMPTAARWLADWAWERAHDDVALRVAIAWAKWHKARAERLPGVTGTRLDACEPGRAIHSWPPVELFVYFDEDVDIEDAADQANEVFSTERFGRLAHWGEACRVMFCCGKDDERGWYALVDD